MRADWPGFGERAERRHCAAGRRRHRGERHYAAVPRRHPGRSGRPPRRDGDHRARGGLSGRIRGRPLPGPGDFREQLAMRAPLPAADGRSHARAQMGGLARRGQPHPSTVGTPNCWQSHPLTFAAINRQATRTNKEIADIASSSILSYKKILSPRECDRVLAIEHHKDTTCAFRCVVYLEASTLISHITSFPKYREMRPFIIVATYQKSIPIICAKYTNI